VERDNGKEATTFSVFDWARDYGRLKEKKKQMITLCNKKKEIMYILLVCECPNA